MRIAAMKRAECIDCLDNNSTGLLFPEEIWLPASTDTFP